jgi:hypothetical protein
VLYNNKIILDAANVEGMPQRGIPPYIKSGGARLAAELFYAA